MKKIIVTGATGSLGRCVIPFLVDRGFEVHAIVRSELPIEGIVVHQVDLFDSLRVEKAVKQIGALFLLHLAWVKIDRLYNTSIENIRWIEASINLLDSFYRAGGKRVVISGSCLEKTCEPYSEPTHQNGFPLYAPCKKRLHELSKKFIETRDLELVWAHLFYLFSPYEHQERFVSAVITGLLEKQTVLCTNGTQVKDYLYVKDAASALAALIDSNLVGNVDVGSGIPVTLKELAKIIERKLGAEGDLRFGAISPVAEEPIAIVANTARLKDELGWHPDYSLDRALDEMIAWQKKSRYQAMVFSSPAVKE